MCDSNLHLSTSRPTTPMTIFTQKENKFGQFKGLFDSFLFFLSANLHIRFVSPLYWLPAIFSLLVTRSDPRFQARENPLREPLLFFFHCSYIIALYASYVYSILNKKERRRIVARTWWFILHWVAALDLSGKSRVFTKQLCGREPPALPLRNKKVWKQSTVVTKCEFPLPQSVCSTLWCTVGTTCHSKLDGAVDGTRCGEDKVSLMSRRDGRLGPWGGGQLVLILI